VAGFTNILVLLSLGSLLLLEHFLWVLGSIGGAVKVGNPDIYDCIGSAFKEATNGIVKNLEIIRRLSISKNNSRNPKSVPGFGNRIIWLPVIRLRSQNWLSILMVLVTVPELVK
jgi:hypothetical protein